MVLALCVPVLSQPLLCSCQAGYTLLTLLYYSLHSYDHELVFGVSLKNMNKAERLAFGESLMTHAMTFTAVSEKVGPPPRHATNGSTDAQVDPASADYQSSRAMGILYLISVEC